MLKIGSYTPMMVTIDAFSDEPYFMGARESFKYIPMLSGVYVVSMVQVNDDASAHPDPSTIFGWNLHATTSDLDLDEPATTWFRYSTKRSTLNKLILIFTDVREEVVGFQHARCVVCLHAKQLLNCFERGLVIWNDIHVYTKSESEYKIDFPSDISAFVMVRAKSEPGVVWPLLPLSPPMPMSRTGAPRWS